MAQMTVGTYLFTRVKQLGIETVLGVPGDYELILLDDIPRAGLSWKGNPNELNASYAVRSGFCARQGQALIYI